MSYFKINGVDYSKYVNALKIDKGAVYTSQKNAAGDTVVDYINSKRTITVGIIPLNAESMATLQEALDNFNVTLSFYNPKTNSVEEGVNCILPNDAIDFYTIQAEKVMYKAFTLTFTEL